MEGNKVRGVLQSYNKETGLITGTYQTVDSFYTPTRTPLSNSLIALKIAFYTSQSLYTLDWYEGGSSASNKALEPQYTKRQ